MAEKVYEVLKDCKYTGKHRVYTAGQQFPESEIFGSKDVALNGQKAIKDGSGKVTQTEKKPVIKLVKAEEVKKAVKK